ncbi:MAG: hypothetical protein AB7T63_07880 [Planctomycetota bacterium]
MPEAPPPRRRRRILRGALVLLVVVTATAAVLLVPRWRGVRLWLDLTGDGALTLGARTLHAVPLTPEEAKAPWAPKAWLASFPPAQGEAKTLPGLLFVHGLAADGLGDERIQRAVHAFCQGGFFVLAPEVASLRWPGEREPDVGDLAHEWRRMVTPGEAPEEADPERAGGVGVSLGGALLLRSVAHAVRAGAQPPRALLLLGVPYDLEPLLAAWSGAPPSGATKGELDDHAFARHAVLQAAAGELFADRPDVHRAVQAWLGAAQVPAGRPATDDADALAFAAFAVDPTADRTWHQRVRDAAWARLGPLSLAQHVDELEVLSAVPVYLVHGRGDRLVPVDQMRALAKHLPRAHVLESSLLGHADIGSATLAERWAHVVDVDDFLDEVDP